MPSTATEWARAKRAEMVKYFGGCCQTCGDDSFLEFAHVKPTKCTGSGRGSTQRIYDVMTHLSHYILLCADCHDSYDGRARRKRQPDIRRSL